MKKESALTKIEKLIVEKKYTSHNLHEFHFQAESAKGKAFYLALVAVLQLLLSLAYSSSFTGLGFGFCALMSLIVYKFSVVPAVQLAEATVKAHNDPRLLKIIQENNYPASKAMPRQVTNAPIIY